MRERNSISHSYIAHRTWLFLMAEEEGVLRAFKVEFLE